VREAFSQHGGFDTGGVVAASAHFNVAFDSETRAAGPNLQAAVPAPGSSAVKPVVRRSPVAKRRTPFRPRLALVASDAVALTLCFSVALQIVHQPRNGSVGSALFANIALSLPFS